MSNYYISGSEEELYHYGVVGMKWGVRRNPTKAYERASKKMNKLNTKAEKAKMKLYKKSGLHLTDFGVAAERKARSKSDYAAGKAALWKKSMEKEFSTARLSTLETKHIRKGEAYMKKITSTSNVKKQEKYSDKASKSYAKSDEYKKLRERIHND